MGAQVNRMDSSSSPVSTTEVNINTAFYDVLFKNTLEDDDCLNSLETSIIQMLDERTSSGQAISENIPSFPNCINEIQLILKDDNADFGKITHLIAQDPLLCSEVLKLANSPYYRTSSKPLESIEMAVSMLGMAGVSIVSAVAMRPLFEVPAIYFKLFGQLIWTHSVECAISCQALAAKDDDAFLCYLLGLVHDVGKILVFQCIVKALKEASTELLPGTITFRNQITNQSKCLSALIAREWSLPTPILTALDDQVINKKSSERSRLGKILYASNLATEVHLLITHDLVDDKECREKLAAKGMSDKLISKIFDSFESKD